MDNDYIDAYDCYNLTMETNILHLAFNEDKKERQLQQELTLDHAVLLPTTTMTTWSSTTSKRYILP